MVLKRFTQPPANYRILTVCWRKRCNAYIPRVADKYDKLKAGADFYGQRRLKRRDLYNFDSVWAKYEKAAKKAGQSFREYMTRFLRKHAP